MPPRREPVSANAPRGAWTPISLCPRSGSLPSQRQRERGRTVPDPLEAGWARDLEPILANDPAVQAVTLRRYLQKTCLERLSDERMRRTLVRRVRAWLALNGAAPAWPMPENG